MAPSSDDLQPLYPVTGPNNDQILTCCLRLLLQQLRPVEDLHDNDANDDGCCSVVSGGTAVALLIIYWPSLSGSSLD